MPAVRTKLTISAPTSAPLQAAEPADHHDHEGQDQRVDAHAQHGRLGRHDDGAAEAGHEAADREGRHVDQPDIQSERRGHAPILRGRAQHHAELGAVDHRPQANAATTPTPITTRL